MPRSFDEDAIRTVAAGWLLSEWLAAEIDACRPTRPRFTEEEASDFGRYLWEALLTAPTHAVPKMPYNLILDLGLKNDGLNPGAEVEVLSSRFRAGSVKWNCHRKFGPSVMFRVVQDAISRIETEGRIDYLLHECSHFGFGRLYGELLADAGLISEIRNTAGRGNEVIPFGGDLAARASARMGTNPITLTLPLGQAGSPHFCLDAATTPLSFGSLAFCRLTGKELPEACGVDPDGMLTKDPSVAQLLAHTERLGNGLGLAIEGLAAAIGGGPPQERCMRSAGHPGGASDCLVTVIHPEYLSCRSGDPLERMRSILQEIVTANGQARLPGTGRRRRQSAAAATITLEGPVLEKLELMASQAEMRL